MHLGKLTPSATRDLSALCKGGDKAGAPIAGDGAASGVSGGKKGDEEDNDDESSVDFEGSEGSEGEVDFDESPMDAVRGDAAGDVSEVEGVVAGAGGDARGGATARGDEDVMTNEDWNGPWGEGERQVSLLGDERQVSLLGGGGQVSLSGDVKGEEHKRAGGVSGEEEAGSKEQGGEKVMSEERRGSEEEVRVTTDLLRNLRYKSSHVNGSDCTLLCTFMELTVLSLSLSLLIYIHVSISNRSLSRQRLSKTGVKCSGMHWRGDVPRKSRYRAPCASESIIRCTQIHVWARGRDARRIQERPVRRCAASVE